jgi:hypothetical protein
MELSNPENLVLCRGAATDMIIFTEKIAPPPPITVAPDEAVIRKLAEDLLQDDRWVKNLIDGLAGVLRDVKH